MADAAADIEERGGVSQTAKDLFSGAAGGIAQVLIGKSDTICLHSWHIRSYIVNLITWICYRCPIGIE